MAQVFAFSFAVVSIVAIVPFRSRKMMRVLGVRGLCGLIGPADFAEEKIVLSSTGPEELWGTG